MALGFVLFARPDIGAVWLATVFGLFSIVHGISAVFASSEVRRSTARSRSAADRSSNFLA